MKPSNQTLPALVLAGAFAATAAPAASVDPDAVLQAVEQAGVGGDVTASVDDDGVARLTGTVDDPSDGPAAAKAAGQVPGVERVVNMLRWDD